MLDAFRPRRVCDQRSVVATRNYCLCGPVLLNLDRTDHSAYLRSFDLDHEQLPKFVLRQRF